MNNLKLSCFFGKSLLLTVFLCLASPASSVNETTIDTDLFIAIPVLRVGSEYYQLRLVYAEPAWQIWDYNIVITPKVVSATFLAIRFQ